MTDTMASQRFIPSPPVTVWNVYDVSGERIASCVPIVKAERLIASHPGAHRSLAPLFRSAVTR